MSIRTNDWDGRVLAGRYVITAKLGEGGMGFVYRARDRNIDADVVVKVPRPSMLEDPEFSGRFAREIRSLVKLSHPRIVKVTDVGEWEGLPFAVMQYLPGGSLEDEDPAAPGGGATAKAKRSDPKDVANWLPGIADALDYVHGQGYVHRDVKPGNILFDAQGHSFLSDFGVAKVLASSADAKPARTAMTGTGMVLGTPEYMAPELIMGEPFDGRVDQYALAVTVYEMLGGRRPFEDDAKTKVLVLHSTKPPPPLDELRPSIPRRLSEAVLRGLAKEPHERYPDCGAFSAAVVAAAAAGLAAVQDARVRIKCPSCGRSLSMSSADFSRLKQSGRSVPCPGCKAPIDASCEGAAPEGRGEARGSTMVLSLQTHSGEHPAAPRDESGGAGGTVAMSARGGTGESASPGTRRTPPAATQKLSAPRDRDDLYPLEPENRPTRTVKEQARPRPAAATSEQAPVHPFGAAAAPVLDDDRATWRPLWTWIAAGVGVGLALVVAFVAVAGLGSRRGEGPVAAADPAGSRQPAAAAPAIVSAPAAPRQELAAPPAAPTRPAAPAGGDLASRRTRAMIEVAGVEAPAKTSDATAADGTQAQAGPDAPEDRPVPATDPGSKLETGPGPAGAAPAFEDPSRAGDNPAAAKVEVEEWTPDLLATKPVRAKVSLEKIIGNPHSYLNQVVIPAGMYRLSSPPAVRADGSLGLVAIESRIAVQRDGSQAIQPLQGSELESEPKFVEQWDESRRRQGEPGDDRPAILTVWVTRRGKCRLFKAEFLTAFRHRVKVGITQKSDMVYEAVTVTPLGSSRGEALDDDWEKVERMLPIAKRYERGFKAIKNRRDAVAQANFDNTMNQAFGQMMRNAAAENAAVTRELMRRMGLSR